MQRLKKIFVAQNKPSRLGILVSKRVPAFTLPELVVGMFLTSLLFVFGYTVYMILSSQSELIHKKNSFYFDYQLTQEVLQRDFTKPGVVTISGDMKTITVTPTDNTSQPVIHYSFDTTYILRHINDRTDTLKPGGIIVAAVPISDSLPLINSVQIRHQFYDKDFFTYLQKKYAASDIVNFLKSTDPIEPTH